MDENDRKIAPKKRGFLGEPVGDGDYNHSLLGVI